MIKRRKFTQYERRFIELRAKGSCEYCKSLHDFSPDTFQIEHIIPLYEGGNNEMDNLAFSCGGCNIRKSNKSQIIDIETNEIVTLFNPRLNVWREHFKWNNNFTEIIAISKVGKATIDLLKLNRIGLINLRMALIAYGVQPDLDL